MLNIVLLYQILISVINADGGKRMRKYREKLLTLAMICLLSVALLPACCSSASSSADISSPALVSKVTEYGIDYSSEETKWIEAKISEYEYKDAYPVSFRQTENDSQTTVNSAFNYEFKDGLPVRMTQNDPYSDLTTEVNYTKKGLVNRILTIDETGRKVGEKVFQYGNRDEYFTLVLHENIISGPDEPVADHMEEIDSIIVTSENGLLRKTVNDGLFANYNDEEEKIWRRFDGSYTANYSKNGILESTSAIFKTFPGSGNQYKFDVTIENGKVSQVIRNAWAPGETDGSWEPEVKYVFEYTDVEISPARYASMINYFILEGGSNYYYYNWY